MKVIVGGVYQSRLDAANVRVTRAMSDPVPTCVVRFRDDTSSLFPQAMQEILVLDDQVIPNPSANLLSNPTLNPYTSGWTVNAFSGISYAQNGGGGVIITLSNAIPTTFNCLTQTFGSGYTSSGQTYVASATVQGSNSPNNFLASLTLEWLDASGNHLDQVLVDSAFPPSTAPTRISVTGTAPSGAAYMRLDVGVAVASSPDSGSVTFTNIQLEPMWFPTISYPTAFIGPSQTNCQQLPNGQWIRQYRKFAGFVNNVLFDNYHGNARQVEIDAVGYAWLLGMIVCNNSYTNHTDAFIIGDLLSQYLPGFTNTSNVITGVTVSNVQSNWDDLRTLFDGLAGLSGFYWTIDYYWSVVYAPPGYFAMPISLICDNSSTPNMTTTFPAYNFSVQQDFTQPGASILVIGNGTNVAKVIDPSSSAQLQLTSGYNFASGVVFQRKINDSTLNSVADCTQRGLAELLIYDYPRGIYHLSTNVELIAGESIQITSSTDNLTQSTQLIQQVTAQWIGTNETLTDQWEYQADLGATNRGATNIISRIHRITQKNTSAPAIGTTTLALIEKIGVVDTVAVASFSSSYVETVQGDGPVAYYRLSNLEGTVVDDWSGNNNTGTTHASPTLGVATLLTDQAPADTSDLAMTFASASSQYVSLPTTFTPTGAHAWSLEAWVNIPSIPANGFYAICSMGTNGTRQAAILLIHVVAGVANLSCATISGDINGPAISATTTYHVVGTYDGTSTRLYQNGVLVAGPTAFVLNLAQSFANIASDRATVTDPFNGTIDEVAFYTTTLTPLQVATHYAAGTSVYALAVMQDAPLRYYRLGEASGTTANDSSSNGQNGTINGGVTLGTTGLIFNDTNTAMTMDGSTGYITAATTGLPTGAASWTIETWINMASVPHSGFHSIVEFGNPASNQAAALFIDGSGHICTNTYLVNKITGLAAANSTTYHCVATYDGTNLRLYINSVLQGTLACTPAISLTYCYIGTEDSPRDDFFPGVVDEVAIYGTALSAARIQAHYNAGTLGHQ